jgi:class 3 adenylate cyclase/tetratricopeptide (TPR) repeat protein
MALHHYLSPDRVRALALGEDLPADAQGAVLLADISGFTQLTETLSLRLGESRGVEALSGPLGEAFDALIAVLGRHGGHAVAFAGDAITGWFDARDDAVTGLPAAVRAVLAAVALQAALQRSPEAAEGLAIKVSVVAGPVRRLVVGDPAFQRLDLMAGPAVARAAQADALALPGDVLADAGSASAAGAAVVGWRALPDGTPMAVLDPAWSPAADAAIASPLPPVPVPPEAVLQPWVHPFVLDRERAGAGWFATDLRPGVALFLRLGAPDAVLHDDAAAGLDAGVRRVQQVLHRHEGVLLELTVGAQGMAGYAVFGAAQAHEDDASRAARAAIELRQALADHPLLQGVGIGIAGGGLRVGGYGGRSRQSFGAQGQATNAAARLMALAGPGEILVSARVRTAVARAFVLQARPPIPIKGQAEPMPVFALQGAQRTRAFRLQEPDFVLPMVGREPELARLLAVLDAAATGTGGVVSVQADAGMGKSRLIAEGIRHALQRGFVSYGGSPAADGLPAPYGLWKGVCAALLGVDMAAAPRAVARAVEAAVARCVPSRAEAWPLLGAVLGTELPDNAFTQGLEPRDRKALLEALVLEAVGQAARDAHEDGGALLLVLEDVQGAEALSCELLAAVVRAAPAWPVCVVVSQRAGSDGRPVGVPDSVLFGEQPVERIVLAGLAPAAAEQLIRAKLAALYPERGGAVPGTLIDPVTERAQGNPFYIEELLNHLHDRGLDPRDERAPSALSWPSSLRSLVLSRIDRLPAPLQTTLKVASVIGRRFTLAQLCGCAPQTEAPQDVLARLHDLAQRGLTPRDDGESEPTFLFQHRVTQEVAYESISRAARAPLHRRVAEHLETTPAVGASSRVFDLAHHWAQAGRPDKAWPWLLQAAEAAAASHANGEALAHLDQVLDWMPPAAAGTRIDVLLRREALCNLLGRHEQRRADLAALEALADAMATSGPPGAAASLGPSAPHDPGEAPQAAARRLRCRVSQRHAQLGLDTGDGAVAAAAAQRALQLADTATDVVEARLLQARALFAAGEAAQARVPLSQALDLARAEGLPAGEANALAQLGLVDWQLGQYERAEVQLLRALVLFREAGELRRELDMLNNLGVVAKARDRFDEALDRYRQAQAIARRIGDRSGEAMLLNNMSSAALAAGDFEQAARSAEQAAGVWDGLGEPGQLAVAWLNRSEAHREMGQTAAAKALGERSLALLRGSGLRRPQATVLTNLGRIAMAQGEWDLARQRFEEGAVLAQEIGLRAVEAAALIGQARVHLARGEVGLAEPALQRAEACLAELGATAVHDELQAVRALHGLAAQHGGSEDAAAAVLSRVAPLVEAWLAVPRPLVLPPLRVLADVARVLAALGHPQAEAVRQLARGLLRERASRLSDPVARRDFLDLPAHRDLLADRKG